jgi:hypothetical protein
MPSTPYMSWHKQVLYQCSDMFQNNLSSQPYIILFLPHTIIYCSFFWPISALKHSTEFCKESSCSKLIQLPAFAKHFYGLFSATFYHSTNIAISQANYANACQLQLLHLLQKWKYFSEAWLVTADNFKFNSLKKLSLLQLMCVCVWCLPVFVGYVAFLPSEHAPLQRVMEQRV